jgi:hypothetical protein
MRTGSPVDVWAAAATTARRKEKYGARRIDSSIPGAARMVHW